MMNFFKTVRLQVALTMLVAAAIPQLAHAYPAPDEPAGAHAVNGTVQQRQWYRPAASFYTPQALKAMGQRYQAQADAIAAKRNLARIAATHDGYVPFVTDFGKQAASAAGSTTSGYVVGGRLIPHDLPAVPVSQHPTVTQPSATTPVAPNDRGGPQGIDPGQPVATGSVDGFDWGDASLGALSGLGASLLLGGALMLAMSRRDRIALS